MSENASKKKCGNCERMKHGSIVHQAPHSTFDFDMVCKDCISEYLKTGEWPVKKDLEQYLDWLAPTMREDYFACEMLGQTRAKRAENRGVDPTTVTENVQRAYSRLKEIAAEQSQDGDLPPSGAVQE